MLIVQAQCVATQELRHDQCNVGCAIVSGKEETQNARCVMFLRTRAAAARENQLDVSTRQSFDLHLAVVHDLLNVQRRLDIQFPCRFAVRVDHAVDLGRFIGSKHGRSCMVAFLHSTPVQRTNRLFDLEDVCLPSKIVRKLHLRGARSQKFFVLGLGVPLA